MKWILILLAAVAFPAAAAGGNLIIHKIPESWTGTGMAEWIEYAIPSGYDPTGPGHPLIVCWHGYGQSCLSVSSESTIDEECEARNWIYLSITGATQNNFGNIVAQIHCSVAIKYMIEVFGLNVDTDRIYMVGCSMGGIGAASYTCRHLSNKEGYPIAGIITVSTYYDLIHAFNSDETLQQILVLVFGCTPSQDPWPYKQISTLFIDNNTYVLHESMGQNMRHKIPAYIAYAENNPIDFIPFQNEIFINMLTDLDVPVMVDYHAFSPVPHSWNLLDEAAAMDFVGQYSLSDQETESISVLADRNVWFYWAHITKAVEKAFSLFSGDADSVANRLIVKETGNIETVRVDCGTTGLGDDNELFIDSVSASPVEQILALQPVEQEPTFIVDGSGVLYPDYTLFKDILAITLPAFADLKLMAYFVPYGLGLIGASSVKIGESYTLTLEDGDPYDLAMMIFGLHQLLTKVAGQYLLVSPMTGSFLFFSLDPTGSASITVRIPRDPGLAGLIIHQQGLTYDTRLKEITNLVSTEITD